MILLCDHFLGKGSAGILSIEVKTRWFIKIWRLLLIFGAVLVMTPAAALAGVLMIPVLIGGWLYYRQFWNADLSKKKIDL